MVNAVCFEHDIPTKPVQLDSLKGFRYIGGNECFAETMPCVPSGSVIFPDEKARRCTQIARRPLILSSVALKVLQVWEFGDEVDQNSVIQFRF
jgi:hypothetical protein